MNHRQTAPFTSFVSGIPQKRQPRDLEQLCQLLISAENSKKNTICVIEDISQKVAEELVVRKRISREFLTAHYEAAGHSADQLWKRGEWHTYSPASDQAHQDPWQQLLGLFEYHDPRDTASSLKRVNVTPPQRLIVESEQYPVCVTTTVSYYHSSPSLYIFLVQSPLPSITWDTETDTDESKPSNLYPTLRFPYAANLGGVLIPRSPSERICSPWKVLTKAFAHAWQVDLIFCTKSIFPNVPLLYILSNSTWESQFRDLDKKIKILCLKEMRMKGRELVNSLYDLREELQDLRVSIDETLFYTQDGVKQFFVKLREDTLKINMGRSPIEHHHDIKERTDQLHTFFMENIQFLLGVISIRDAEDSAGRAHKTTILTALATIYLPLSLATSTFGMNLSEMDGTGPKVWIFAITCVSLLIATVLVVLLVFYPPSISVPDLRGKLKVSLPNMQSRKPQTKQMNEP